MWHEFTRISVEPLEEEAEWEGEEESMNPDDEFGIEELLDKLKRASDEPDLFS